MFHEKRFTLVSPYERTDLVGVAEWLNSLCTAKDFVDTYQAVYLPEHNQLMIIAHVSQENQSSTKKKAE